MDWMELLQQLTAPAGVSGSEMQIAETAFELLSPMCDEVYMQQGNVCGTFGKHKVGKPHVMLDAHMDQIGFLITAITPDGFVRVGNAGGMDYRLMPAQRVVLQGKKDILGVISCIPPHLQGDREHVLPVTQLAIDTGLSKDELEQWVELGDSVSFDMPLQTLQNGRVTGASLDDRCGMAAILYALQLVQGEDLPCSVSILFSTQEELGERGAKIGAYTLNPDIAIAVDVTFALGHNDDPVKYGRLGGGPMIGISPSLSREVSDALIKTAKDAQIPWQPEVMAGTTGTNADQFSVTRGGIRSGTVSIPLRYMHTPSELIQISDVKQTGELLAAYLRGCASC